MTSGIQDRRNDRRADDPGSTAIAEKRPPISSPARGHPIQAYDFRPIDFDRLWKGRERTTSLEKAVVARALKRAVRGRVLEVGPGGGRLTPMLTGRFPEYVGVDVTVEFLRRLARLDGSPDWLVAADVHHLPFVDSSFSAVVMIRVYNFLVNPPQALDELKRVLAPGGYLLLSYHPLRSLATLHDLIRHAMEDTSHAGPTPAGGVRSPPELPSRRSFAATLATAGFELVDEFVTGVEDNRLARWIPTRCYLGLSELMVEVPLFPQRFVLAKKASSS